MERALYLDPVSGISGNMFVGVLLDLGVPQIWLINELQKLGLDDYELIFEKVNKRGITATYFNVDVQETTTHRHLPDILTILARADWSGSAKQRWRKAGPMGLRQKTCIFMKSARSIASSIARRFRSVWNIWTSILY